ncbi:heterokaryon incompatibility protein-domain-containing protein, partial [Hyaloscypha sp. PMI_1271]
MQETYNLIAKLNGPAAKRIYQPLGHGYIRLVILHPGHRPLLECSLAAHYLTSPPKYEALSYAWGSPHKPRRILLNGHLFHVTQNLYDVLNRLRYTSIERLIWVDALAINQSDVLERSEQVSIMRNIYSTANRTLVWLGEGDE